MFFSKSATWAQSIWASFQLISFTWALCSRFEQLRSITCALRFYVFLCKINTSPANIGQLADFHSSFVLILFLIKCISTRWRPTLSLSLRTIDTNKMPPLTICAHHRCNVTTTTGLVFHFDRIHHRCLLLSVCSCYLCFHFSSLACMLVSHQFMSTQHCLGHNPSMDLLTFSQDSIWIRIRT